MKKGDTVRTPRFLTVTIKEVYESREDATRDGFTGDRFKFCVNSKN